MPIRVYDIPNIKRSWKGGGDLGRVRGEQKQESWATRPTPDLPLAGSDDGAVAFLTTRAIFVRLFPWIGVSRSRQF